MSEKAEQRKLWDIQLEILDVVDRLCRENNLHYSLYAGSLLGAVRHRGFIPWDDDLDICMSREDYERFLKIWKDEEHPGYLLQNKRNTPSFTQSFSKIRKDHTAFLQYEWEIGRYHTGIFVDIFPIDRFPASYPRYFRFKCLKYQLFMREFIPSKASLLIKTVSGVLLGVSSRRTRNRYRKTFEKELRVLSDRKDLQTVAIETLSTIDKLMPTDLLDEYVYFPFEGREYQCFAKYDEYLRIKYGDYMQLPPENERVWKHNHLVIDFDHNYGELNHE